MNVRRWLSQRFPLWIGRGGTTPWPPRSPDLNPMDYFVWGFLKSEVYKTEANSEEEVRRRIIAASEKLKESLSFSVTVGSMRKRARLCVRKDETNGKPNREFRGLRAKCYSVLLHDKQEKKVAKGVLRTAIKTQLRHEAYKQCLFQQMPKSTTGLSIRSERHHVFTKKSKKLSLSPFDDKRYILDDGVHTLPYGHYKIREMRNRKRKREELPHPPTSRPRSPQPSTSRPGSPQPSTSRPWSPQPSTSRQEPS